MLSTRVGDLIEERKLVLAAPDTSVAQAAGMMKQHEVGALLVVEQGRLVGIFTERDAVVRVMAPGLQPATTVLSDVMTRDPDTIPPRRAAIEALRLMQDGGYRHLPVVDKGKVVGVVSRGDFRGLEQARLDEETGLWERI